MLRNVSLEEISDGRLYGLNDMAKLGCNDCAGCSSCCRGMGNTIVLDPYDVWRLTGGLGVSLQQLLAASGTECGGRDHSAKSETGGGFGTVYLFE